MSKKEEEEKEEESPGRWMIDKLERILEMDLQRRLVSNFEFHEMRMMCNKDYCENYSFYIKLDQKDLVVIKSLDYRFRKKFLLKLSWKVKEKCI